MDVALSTVGLLRGSIDRIRMHGTNLTRGDVRVGTLDLTASGVSSTDLGFDGIAGQVTTLVIPVGDAAAMTIDRVSVSGPSDAVLAVATLDADAALALVGGAFADAGMAVQELALNDRGVSFRLLGQVVAVPIGVEDGALIVPDLFGISPLVVLEPGRDDPWRLIGVSMSPNGMTIDVVLDATGLAGGD